MGDRTSATATGPSGNCATPAEDSAATSAAARRAARPHCIDPRSQRRDVPAARFGLRRRHVRGNLHVAPREGVLDVAGDALAVTEHRDRCARHAHVHLGARMPERHRVIVVGDLDVTVDPDSRHLPFGVFVAPSRIVCMTCWSISAKAWDVVARRPFEGLLVQVGHQCLEQAVHVVAAKEALVVQLRAHLSPAPRMPFAR